MLAAFGRAELGDAIGYVKRAIGRDDTVTVAGN